jgi:hypothetical protein
VIIRKPIQASILACMMLLAVFALPVAAENAPSSSTSKEGGWVSLFNGKDLAGWQKAHEPRVDPLWTVEDGAMTNQQGARDIATVADYRDFELTLEYKTVKGGNSGVFLRGRTEVQVFDSYGKEKPGDDDNGAIYGQFAPKVNASKPAGEWNALEIHFVGDTITVKLNGQLVQDNVKLSEVCGGALPGDLLDPGPIRLQGDHGKVWYRNLKLRPIPSNK